MIVRKLLFFFLCGLFFNAFILVPEPLAGDNILIIANKNVPVDALTKKDIEKIFLGIKKQWPDKSKIKFAILKYNNAQHEAFLSEYLNKSSRQYTAYWRNQIFLGKGVLPSTFESEPEIINYVKNTKGAIGYVSKSASTEPVKIITISN